MNTDNITINAHSSIRIKTDAGVVYFDPFKIGEPSNDADYVFLTHDHFDHFSPEDMEKVIKKDTVIITPESTRESVEPFSRKVSRIICVVPGKEYTAGGLSFQTVPAYNPAKKFHPKENGWCGYVLCADGVRYYVAGDTDKNPENSLVNCDIAFIPAGGTYTFDHREAAEFANLIKPAIAIPTHYGCIVGDKTDGDAFAALLSSGILPVLKL